MSQTVELPRVGGPGSGVGGLWRVVVLNDDHNTFDHVAETLASVIPGITLADGLPVRRPDPQHGLRDRLERCREDAEVYWERLDAAGLTMAPLESG